MTPLRLRRGNLWASLPSGTQEESFEILTAAQGLRVERIVTPPGVPGLADQWYDQEEDEWVILLAGSAALEVAGVAAEVELAPGDYLLLPAHQRHRVLRTDVQHTTVWLAVHFQR